MKRQILLIVALSVIPAINGTSLASAQDALFRRFDKDGDGRISRQEAKGTLPTMITHKDIRYAEVPPGTNANLLSLDIYLPNGADQSNGPRDLPVMIYVHGGGWTRGDKSAVHAKPEYFTRRGFVFVSVNYRLVPGVDILTQLQDSGNAVGWVKNNIGAYGGDPTRLHLIGHSAGAHHVAILATNERFLSQAGVQLGDLKSVVVLDTQALDLPRAMQGNDKAIYRRAFGQDPAVWREVSPSDNVTKGKGIPPFCLVVADGRRPKLVQAAEFQKSLQVADVQCDIIEAPQHDHSSLNHAIGVGSDDVTKAIEQFHDSILVGPAIGRESGSLPSLPRLALPSHE